MSVATEADYDTQLVGGIRAALRKARELGYPVESMDVTASVSEGVCNVHFARIAAPGYIVAGGDLTLTVNADTDELIEVKRGQ
jgi:hypothetical protein